MRSIYVLCSGIDYNQGVLCRLLTFFWRMFPFYNSRMGILTRSGLIQYMLTLLSDEEAKLFIAKFGIPRPNYFNWGIILFAILWCFSWAPGNTYRDFLDCYAFTILSLVLDINWSFIWQSMVDVDVYTSLGMSISRTLWSWSSATFPIISKRFISIIR